MLDSNTLAWLRLTLIPGIGPITLQQLVGVFGSASNVLEAANGGDPWKDAALQDAVRAGLAEGQIEQAVAWAQQPGHHLICYEDVDYPRALREIATPPGLLYAMGDTQLLQAASLAIVGSRNATPQGARDAHDFARAASAAGICVTSGLALGIDAAAHEGALEARGRSVAVMGTGPDTFYPRRNRALAARLVENGCVITEFPLGVPPSSGNFPRRNRLISGLSRAVLVVEANESSGSLSTANFALEQNRDVLAVPGSIHSPLSKGCHKLIREGAALVENSADVLRALGIVLEAGEPARARARRHVRDDLLDAMIGAPVTLDQLAMRTGLPAATVAARICLHQLEGRVEEIAGGTFQRIDRPSQPA